MSPRSLYLLAVACLTLLLAGCGGSGGGGGSAKGQLIYITDWTNTGGINGQSQRVALSRPDGTFVQSQIVNRDIAGPMTITFSNLTQGVYHVVVQLNSLPNFSGNGVVTGEIEADVTVGKSTQFKTAVGDDISSLQVTPPTATIKTQESIDFTATGLNAEGEAVFLEPDSITWQANGNVVTVDQDGLALGVAEGQGSVVATHTDSGLTDAGAVTVSAFTVTKSKWTVLVYLNAANDLNEFGDVNFDQLERVAGNKDVRFVVQWKQALLPGISSDPSFTGTRRYLVKKDTQAGNHSQLIQNMGDGVDMGDANVLKDFIVWGKTFFPADRYVLVIWNHGNGWRRSASRDNPTRGVSYDDETGNSINTWELNQAIGNQHFDIIAWDASLMQMLEVAYEIKTKADYIVGSEESPPGAGYPYHTVFDNFEANPDAPTQTLANSFVDATLAVPEYATQKITQSVLDTSRLNSVVGAASQLANALTQERQKNPAGFTEYIQAARTNAQSYSPTSGRVYRDLWDLTLELDKTVAGYSPTANILAANLAVRNAISSMVVHEGHNAQSPKSHGIAIDFSNSVRYQGFAGDYEQMQIALDSNWDLWLSVAP